MPSKPSTMTVGFSLAACVLPQPLHAAAAKVANSSATAPRRRLLTGERLLVERLAVHVGGRVQAEQAQHGGGDVHQRRVGAVDAPAREEDAGHEPRVDAVVPAPGLDVVLEDGPRDDTGGAVPGRAVTGV